MMCLQEQSTTMLGDLIENGEETESPFNEQECRQKEVPTVLVIVPSIFNCRRTYGKSTSSLTKQDSISLILLTQKHTVHKSVKKTKRQVRTTHPMGIVVGLAISNMLLLVTPFM